MRGSAAPHPATSMLLKVVAVIALSWQLMGAGCAAFMATGLVLDEIYKSTAPEHELERSLKEATGRRRDEIEEEFGEPASRIRELESEVTYSIYSLSRSHSAGCAAPGVCWGAGVRTYCFLLKFDRNDVLTETTMREGSWSCSGVFWSEQEAARLLTVSVLERDRNTSVALRRKYGDTGPLRRLAEDGDLDAALSLARDFDEYDFLPDLSDSVSAETAYAIYDVLRMKEGQQVQSIRWLCTAANAQHPMAQRKLGIWHSPDSWWWWKSSRKNFSWLQDTGLVPDDVLSYKWYSLASENGDEFARRIRWNLDSRLTDEQILRGTQLAEAWVPGQCP